MKVLLSIKPEFVHEIFQGRKKYEYRKSIFTKHVTKVLVYSTKPEGMIVGEFSVRRILNDTPENLWEKTSAVSGITKEFFDQYGNGDQGTAATTENFSIFFSPFSRLWIKTGMNTRQSYDKKIRITARRYGYNPHGENAVQNQSTCCNRTVCLSGRPWRIYRRHKKS